MKKAKPVGFFDQQKFAIIFFVNKWCIQMNSLATIYPPQPIANDFT